MKDLQRVEQLVEAVWSDVISTPIYNGVDDAYARVNRAAREIACTFVLSDYKAARCAACSPEARSARSISMNIARRIVHMIYEDLGSRSTAVLLCDLSHLQPCK